uniref:Uncharacterized protein n=1 Tax=viral metagenome TaxID=1070528 RepID=A0A6C0CIN3_9ZZZZ
MKELMIRDEVLFWGAAVLLVFFAFVMMPAHERFRDAQGREVDVSPNAPPKPEWLKPINERTGKREGFWGLFSSFFTPTREKMTGGTSSACPTNGEGMTIVNPTTNESKRYYTESECLGMAGVSGWSSEAQGDLASLSMEKYCGLGTCYSRTGNIGLGEKIFQKCNLTSAPSALAAEAGAGCITHDQKLNTRFSQPPLSGITAQQSTTPPQFNTDSTLGSTSGTSGMERTVTQGDLREAQVRFIQTLIGNEPDQATKLALSQGLSTLQQVVKGAPVSLTNVPLGTADKQIYTALTNVPGTYRYSQFAFAFQAAGGTNPSPENIVNMLQNIPSNFNPSTAPRSTVSNVSQMSQSSALTPPDLYGPGPNVLRSALQSCTCASQTSGCPTHG